MTVHAALLIISGDKSSGWCGWPAAQILKVEMLTDILVVDKYDNIQVDLGVKIRFMFYQVWRVISGFTRDRYLVRNE